MVKRRRIRWDRIFITAALFIGLILLLGSCAQKCSRSRTEESSAASPLEPLGSSNSGSVTGQAFPARRMRRSPRRQPPPLSPPTIPRSSSSPRP